MILTDFIRNLTKIKKKHPQSPICYYDSIEGISKLEHIRCGYVLKDLPTNKYKDEDVLTSKDIIGKEDQYILITIVG